MLTKDLQIAKKSLSVHGPGADLLTITTSTHHIVVSSSASISVFDLTFTGSKFNSTSVLTNSGTLTLIHSTVSGNTAPYGSGGGITNAGGTLTLTDSIVSGNTASNSSGGGILNSGGALALIDSIVSGNMVSGQSSYGGGIYNYLGTLTLTDSIVSDNRVSRGSGGGIYNYDGTLNIIRSTISGNTTFSDGGGIINVDSPLTLTNSTVSGNTASNYDGGGILNLGGKAIITFCTIYGNTAKGPGGGISIEDDHDVNPPRPGQLVMRNSLVAGNHAHSGPDIAGTTTTDGYNLVGDRSGATFLGSPEMQSMDVLGVSSTALGIDPKLHNWTHALLPGSPAIDRIPADACLIMDITTDQRSVKRPDDNENKCDIGAYESSP